MLKHTAPLILFLFAIVIFTVPPTVTAVPSIEQVKAKVESLYKKVKENQPYVTAEEFMKIKESGKKFVLIDDGYPVYNQQEKMTFQSETITVKDRILSSRANDRSPAK